MQSFFLIMCKIFAENRSSVTGFAASGYGRTVFCPLLA
jgi:hypothetical protein